MTDISSPHDHFFRLTLSDIIAAREFITRLFPKEIITKIKLDTLEGCDSSFISQELHLRVVDKLFSVEFSDSAQGFLYILAEHQSQPVKLMPFRTLQYRFCIWDHHHHKTDKHEFPPILVVVFYHGKTQWNYSKRFLDLFEAHHRADIANMLENTFELIDVNQIPDETLRQQTKFSLMALTMKHIYRKDLIEIIRDIRDIVTHLAETGQKEYIISTLIYVFRTAHVGDVASVLDYLKKSYHHVVGENDMPTMAQYFEQQGRQQGLKQGLEQGLEQGLHQGKLETAREMLREGFIIERIAKITKLDITEILDEAEKLKSSSQ